MMVLPAQVDHLEGQVGVGHVGLRVVLDGLVAQLRDRLAGPVVGGRRGVRRVRVPQDRPDHAQSGADHQGEHAEADDEAPTTTDSGRLSRLDRVRDRDRVGCAVPGRQAHPGRLGVHGRGGGHVRGRRQRDGSRGAVPLLDGRRGRVVDPRAGPVRTITRRRRRSRGSPCVPGVLGPDRLGGSGASSRSRARCGRVGLPGRTAGRAGRRAARRPSPSALDVLAPAPVDDRRESLGTGHCSGRCGSVRALRR